MHPIIEPSGPTTGPCEDEQNTGALDHYESWGIPTPLGCPVDRRDRVSGIRWCREPRSLAPRMCVASSGNSARIALPGGRVRVSRPLELEVARWSESRPGKALSSYGGIRVILRSSLPRRAPGGAQSATPRRDQVFVGRTHLSILSVL